jgi:uncharacterized protein
LINLFLAMDTMLTPDFLRILACPACKGELLQSEDSLSLHCISCSKAYPVVEGIPVLLPEHTGTSARTKGEAT